MRSKNNTEATYVAKTKKRKYSTPKSTSAKLWVLNKKIKRANYNINSRLNNYAIYGGQQTMAQTGVYSRITNIAAGTGPATRADRSITLRAILLKYTTYSADTFNVCRVALIQARGSYPGAVPVDAGVVQAVSGGGGMLPVVQPINQELWHILYDETMNFTTASWSNQSAKTTIIPRQKIIRFADSTGTTATSGDIFACFWSDSGAATHPGCDWFAKLYYSE